MSEQSKSDAVRDPFYQQIVTALAGLRAHDVFERCMGDLLTKDFSGLVPVPGGGDFGVDGLIPDAEGGEPFPLVCTTQEDVLGNLTKSLDSYLRRGLPSRKVALATSRFLTPPRKMNLFDRAREKGFVLMQVFDQPALADRLYENSRWCKELLKLSGAPSILSIVPATRRPLIEIEPVGRDADIAWLREIRGDSVLSGEPGSGKTFLVYHLIRAGWPGLFLAPGAFDRGALVLALQEKKPEIVVVDDAHADPDLLVDLIRLRREKEMGFRILATTWKGGEPEVLDALGGLPPDRVRRLGLLSRDEILHVFRSVGVAEDNDGLMRHLVDQAANKPGLAVTIATLWLQGSWQVVVEGTALSRTLTGFFQQYLGREATDVLAAFSLGGARGMRQEAVREFLELSRTGLRRILTGLFAGGVLFEAGEDAWKVNPPVLRAPLLRSVFFPDDAPRFYKYGELLEDAPDLSSAVEGLVQARQQGAAIPIGELRELVASVPHSGAWRRLALLGEDDARWVLKNYRGDVIGIAREALDSAPEPTIGLLMERATTTDGPLHSQPDHPLRILQDWVKELDISPAEMTGRRKMLARICANFLRDGGARTIGCQGLCFCLSPGVEGCTQGPGSGDVLHIRSGLMPLECILRMNPIWKDVFRSLGSLSPTDWPYLSAALWEWLSPDHSSGGVDVPKETRNAMHSFAEGALRDLSSIAEGSSWLSSGLRYLASQIEIDLGLACNETFELLFPPPADKAPDIEAFAAARVALQALAQSWSKEDPDEVAYRLALYEEAAQVLQYRWPRRPPVVASILASLVSDPAEWVEALSRRNVPGDVIQPFLDAVGSTHFRAWEENAELLLLRPEYMLSVAEKVLPLPSPPALLLEKVVEQLTRHPECIHVFCLRGQVSLVALKVLLRHSEIAVALAAAAGEWASDPVGEVREELLADWRAVILRSKDGDFSGEHKGFRQDLAEILTRDPVLSFDWLRARLREPMQALRISERSPAAKALAVLNREQRLNLLNELNGESFAGGLISLLVAREPEVYKRLLSLELLKRYAWAAPLAFVPDEAWMELALLAHEAGFSAREIASASFSFVGTVTFWGSEADYWSPWQEAFTRFENDPREDACAIGRCGRQIAAERIQKIREVERLKAIQEASF